MLQYTNWRNFSAAVRAAMVACETSGFQASDHFDASIKMIPLGKGAHQEVEDFHLSRYACYLIVQSADTSKPVVALGQTYFAAQTRKAELADARDALAGLSEDERHLLA